MSVSLQRLLQILFLLFIQLAVACVLGSNGSMATSLWGANARSLYAPPVAAEVGDLVTILVVENAEAKQEVNTATSKEAQVSIDSGQGLLRSILPGLGIGADDNLEAGGATSRGGQLTAKLTATIVEVTAEGNYVVQGRQKIVINSEEQEITLHGLIRPEDIRHDNTVLSTSLADAEITYKGSGALAGKSRPGILTRLFNWLF